MKCPQCIQENKTSTVAIWGSMTTAMYYTPYYDKDGKYHHHDGNTITTDYRCSNGHKWMENSKRECPTCGKWWESENKQKMDQ